MTSGHGHEVGGVIDSDYLPFTPDDLLEHFADVGSTAGDPERHVKYYVDSATNKAALESNPPVGTSAQVARAKRRAFQMQKDERFWVVTTLMKLFRRRDRLNALSELLIAGFGESPPIPGAATWPEALGTEQHLYFEVNLPSPLAYRQDLAEHLDERILAIPFLRAAAAEKGTRLEGATKVDAMLISPATGFAVLFEAKVLSDVSGGVEYDVLRNQIARNIDVMLEPNPRLTSVLARRRPERTCFALLTPEVFRRNPRSRLYGWLFGEYQQDPPKLLQAHLPHRTQEELQSVPNRLAWLTWEDCNRVRPGACPWLDKSGEDASPSR